MTAICDFCIDLGFVTEATVKFRGSYYCSHHARWVLGPLPAVVAETKVPA